MGGSMRTKLVLFLMVTVSITSCSSKKGRDKLSDPTPTQNPTPTTSVFAEPETSPMPATTTKKGANKKSKPEIPYEIGYVYETDKSKAAQAEAKRLKTCFGGQRQPPSYVDEKGDIYWSCNSSGEVDWDTDALHLYVHTDIEGACNELYIIMPENGFDCMPRFPHGVEEKLRELKSH